MCCNTLQNLYMSLCCQGFVTILVLVKTSQIHNIEIDLISGHFNFRDYVRHNGTKDQASVVFRGHLKSRRH